MKKSHAPTLDTEQVDYAALSQELNEVMSKLEAGGLDVDAAVGCYQRGLQIVQLLETRLLKAENRVAELREAFAADELSNDWAETATEEE